MFGLDLTGRRLSDLAYPVDRLWHEYRTCVRERRPIGIGGKPLSEKDHCLVDKMILPLAGDDGTVNHLMIGIAPASGTVNGQYPTPPARPAKASVDGTRVAALR